MLPFIKQKVAGNAFKKNSRQKGPLIGALQVWSLSPKKEYGAIKEAAKVRRHP